MENIYEAKISYGYICRDCYVWAKNAYSRKLILLRNVYYLLANKKSITDYGRKYDTNT